MQEAIINRKLSVSPNIIYSLIFGQAGSLAKALLECIMNSEDAGATKVDIKLTPQGLKVTDDGKGFATREDILKCFEVFGFEHTPGERVHGRFGLGRGQLWAWCSTIWSTNQFEMHVDIKNKGLDYVLKEGLKNRPGLCIEGTFYEPQTTRDILTTERDLSMLAAYVKTPVTFNGKRINRDPLEEKWTHTTDDAYIRLSSELQTLSVFSQGVLVRSYPAYTFGIGGVVVTRVGVELALNIARNDILQSECKVWKRIKPFLQGKADEAIKKSKALTDEQVYNLVLRFIAGEINYQELSSRRLIVDVLGKKHTLQSFLAKASSTFSVTITSVADTDAGRAAEEAHKRGHCFVLSKKTLKLFNVDSVGELMSTLETTLMRSARYLWQSTKHSLKGGEFVIVENWQEACKAANLDSVEIPQKDWTPREKCALAALSYAQNYLVYTMMKAGVSSGLRARTLRLGTSVQARAWTNSTTSVWFNRESLKQADQGLSGAVHLVNLLAHELLHDCDTSGSHVHSMEFYERFHTLQLFEESPTGSYLGLGEIARHFMSKYSVELRNKDLPVRAATLKALDTVERNAPVPLDSANDEAALKLSV